MNEFRPTTFEEIMGQDVAKTLLQRRVDAFQKTGKVSGHMILAGAAGLGKSTLALVTSEAMGVPFISVMGTSINSWVEMLRILNQLEPNTVVFVDEIHAFKQKTQEELYGVLEDFQYDSTESVTVTKWRTVKKNVPPFTMIGATTHIGLLGTPLRRRFPLVVNLVPYTIDELAKIVVRRAYREFGLTTFSGSVAERIANLSKCNSAQAVNLLKNLMENVEAITAGTVTADDVTINALEETLYLQGLDPIIGLDRPSRSYLQVLAKDSTLLGANAIAVMIGEQEEVITSVIEPFLLSSVEATAKVSGKTVNIAGALAERTPHGRAITETGVQYLQYCKELQETAGWFPGEKL